VQGVVWLPFPPGRGSTPVGIHAKRGRRIEKGRGVRQPETWPLGMAATRALFLFLRGAIERGPGNKKGGGFRGKGGRTKGSWQGKDPGRSARKPPRGGTIGGGWGGRSQEGGRFKRSVVISKHRTGTGPLLGGSGEGGGEKKLQEKNAAYRSQSRGKSTTGLEF